MAKKQKRREPQSRFTLRNVSFGLFLVFVLIAAFAPGVAAILLNNVLSTIALAAAPLIGPLVGIAVALFGIRLIFSGRR